MADAAWQDLREHFERALALGGTDRAAYLDALAATDAADASLVRALVDAHERDPEFLETAPTLDDGDVSLDEADGRRVGPYRLERTLGEGGMGVVYLATHEDGAFRRQVALKLAREELASPYLTERFAAERDILARLTHPNIAHLYDGGITPSGRPYLVMEYVVGTPITEHCARYALSLPARLALVQAVCRTVDHAHRHFVIHRDLKPSNILVTAEGEVKLLDFGVAKVLEPDAPSVPATAAAAEPRTVVALTPAYAAPEQLRRGRVTAATDVYGIGVLAYELVAGRRPHQLDGLSLGDVERIVTAVDPPPPTLGAPDARGRRARPADVDLVILKALRREPEERYATPRDLADDIARLLDGRPVAARTPTLGYRVRRFVHRNRARVLAATLAAAALAITTGLAVHQAAVATAAARRAARINTFLQGVLASANPSWYVESREKGPSVTVLRALELAAERMERELADDPETRADIHHTLGDTYRALGATGPASRHFERALAIRQRIFRPPHPKIADALFYVVGTRFGEGHWDASIAALDAALAMQRQRDVGNNLPYIMEAAASLRAAAGDYRGSLAQYAEALALARARYPEEHMLVVSLRHARAETIVSFDAPGAPRPPAADRTPALDARLAARDGDFRRADSLFAAARGAVDAASIHAVRIDLARVRTVLLPMHRWREARAVLAAAPLGVLRHDTPGVVVEEAQRRALGAALDLGEGHMLAAADGARATIALIDSALGGARFDPFWDSRVLARSVLARTAAAAGRVDSAARLLRANADALARRGIRGPALDTVQAALAQLASGSAVADGVERDP